MFTNTDLVIYRERLKALQRDAERQRLARIARASDQYQRKPTWQRTLVRLWGLFF